MKRNHRTRPKPRPNAKDKNQHQTRTNIKDKRNHRHTGRPKPTPNANQQKGKTKPPRTRNSQSQKRNKRPNHNQPQSLGPLQEELGSIDCASSPPPAGAIILRRVYGQLRARGGFATVNKIKTSAMRNAQNQHQTRTSIIGAKQPPIGIS